MTMLRAILLVAFLSLAVCPILMADPTSHSDLGLDQIVLDISPQQLAGRPLVGRARILLLDVQNNLQVNYNLFTDPLILSTLGGAMVPTVLNDPTWVDSGIVDLAKHTVRYSGRTGEVPVAATNGIITSSSVLVTFNGYDILYVTDFKGDSLTGVFSGHSTTIRVAVQNAGDLLSETSPSLRAFFASGGGSTRVFFTAHNKGVVDTVTMSLPTTGLQPGSDTLLVVLESAYRIDTTLYTIRDTLKIPQIVYPLASVNLVTGSIKPDSVYAGENFPLSFNVAAPGFEGPLDSGYAKLELTSAPGLPSLTTIYDAPVTNTGYENNVIQYTDLPAKIDLAAGLLPGWYRFRMSYTLVSGGSVFSFSSTQLDSIFILPFTSPQYVPGTFAPDTVAAGSLAEFQFDLTVVDTVTLQVNPTLGTATFVVGGSGGFLAQGNLIVPNFTLKPGRTTVHTEKIFVPSNQLGQDLSISANLQYKQGGVTYLNYSTNFDGQSIHVQQLPIAQITHVDVVAPNAPKVDVGQQYGIQVSVANVSTIQIDSLVLRLTSDGTSVDTLYDTVAIIPSGDTVDVLFPVISQDANPNELFRAEIVSQHHGQIAPADDIALVQVQIPASIRLTASINHRSNDSLPPFYYQTGSNLDLTVNLINLGQADVTPASYHLSTDGIDISLLHPNWDTVGDLSVGGVGRTFRLSMPHFDTSFTLSFTITDRPLDMNTGTPSAVQGDTAFTYQIAVASTEAALYAAPVESQPVPLYRGGVSRLLQLQFNNLAQSLVNSIRVDSVKLQVLTTNGQPKSSASTFESGSIAFYEGETKVASDKTEGNLITVVFDNYVVEAGAEKTLTLMGTVVAEAGESFVVALDTNAVYARYADGPAQDEEVQISAPPNGGSIFKRVFTVSAATLAQSFMIQNNPWHPEVGKARFAYTLPKEEALDLRIFTLTGEAVLTQHFDASSAMAAAGPHIYEWDGHNGEGQMVRDGIYIVILSTQSGEEARVKVAVIK